jgi:hypothetical protein
MRVAKLACLAALAALGCSSTNDERVSSQPQGIGADDDGTDASDADATHCRPRPPRFWADHIDAWPLASLTLGGTSYSKAQLVAILRMPLDDDASIVLGRQLIAAMLDVARGTDPSPVTATIADANDLLSSGTIPLGVPIFSIRGLRMLEDAAVLADFTAGLLTRACAAPTGSCEAWSEVSVLVTGRDVVAYVAKGNWFPATRTGISVVDVEGTRVAPTLIPTPEVVNTCASNPFTGRTVCTGKGTDVYLLSGTTLQATLTSGGSGTLSYGCTDCGVTMDAIHDRALIGLAFESDGLQAGGYQVLDLGSSPSFESPIPTSIPFGATNAISTGVLVDPFRNLVLSPSERGPFEIVNVTTSTSPQSFLRPTGEAESAGEDCSTGIVVAPEGPILGPPPPLRVHIIDLTQATFTPGMPGSWDAPFAFDTVPGAPNQGWGAVAVAQGTHTGIFAGEVIESDHVVAFTLPSTSGSGTPGLVDSVACGIPIFTTQFQPQTVTAYQSPNGGDAMAVVVSFDATEMAVIDLTKMLDATIVPRTADGRACAAGSLPSSVLRLVSVP